MSTSTFSVSVSSPVHVNSLSQLKSASYLVVVSGILLIYDYFLTFGEELEYVWKRRWSYVAVLFIYTRYSPFVDTALFAIRQFYPDPSPRACLASWYIVTYSYTCGLAVVEFILIIRTYAIWNHSKKIAIGLPSLLLASVAGIIYLSQKYIFSIEFVHSPYSTVVLPGCYIKTVDNVVYGCYAILLGHETVIFLLTVTKIIYQRNLGTSSIATVVYRDGLLYYMFILVTTIATITLMATASGTVATSLTPLHRVLHTILAQRLVLNIRGAAETVESTTTPTIAFATAEIQQVEIIEMDTIGESRDWSGSTSRYETDLRTDKAL